jgi:hypothetical protein
MKKLLVVLHLALILSCGSNKNELFILPGLSVQVHDQETVIPISTELSTTFQHYQQNTGLTIPLTKSIHHEQYDLYVGIPFNTSLNEVASALQRLDKVLDFKHDSTTVFAAYSVDEYAVRLIAAQAGQNLVYLLAVAPTVTAADSLFSRSQLSDRLLLK